MAIWPAIPCFAGISHWGSFPYAILMISLMPLAKLLVGTAIGPIAASISLTIGAVPFFARLVETALRDVPAGKLDAAHAMGSTRMQSIRKVLVPEAMPTLVDGVTTTLVTLVGYSTMAGAIGGGGVGDFAIRYGYQRFNTPVLLMAVVVLIVVVQIVQSAGDALVRSMAHRRG